MALTVFKRYEPQLAHMEVAQWFLRLQKRLKEDVGLECTHLQRAVCGGPNGKSNVKGWLPSYLEQKALGGVYARTGAGSQSEYQRNMEWLNELLKRKQRDTEVAKKGAAEQKKERDRKQRFRRDTLKRRNRAASAAEGFEEPAEPAGPAEDGEAITIEKEI